MVFQPEIGILHRRRFAEVLRFAIRRLEQE
jgi:hypothetical protein